MKRILLDENLPLKLIEFAPKECDVRHVIGEGWKRMPDGELLSHAKSAGFDVLMTADRNMAFSRICEPSRFLLSF